MVSQRESSVVVVTGASAGIGRATAVNFAQQGYDVGLLARGRGGLEAAARDVRACGQQACIVECDVSNATCVEDAARTVEDELGPIDVWVNNAMVSVFSPVMETTADEFKRVTEVTYLGYVYGTLSALRRMKPRNRGTVIQVGSALAYRSIPLQSAYCAAKHAIVGFTDSLRTELIRENSRVHVCVVHMPAVNTPQFAWVKSRLPNKPQPVPPIYQPEVAAEAIYFAAHHRRRELWVGAPTIKAIVGDKIAPGLLDHYLAWNGFQSQQTQEPVDTNRRDNLWEPLDRDQGNDYGAHGAFDRRSRIFSPVFELSRMRPGLTAMGLAGVALLGASIVKRVLTSRD